MTSRGMLAPLWTSGMEDTDDRFYDLNMCDALAKYLVLGLDPGNFGIMLLMGRYEGAKRAASSLLTSPSRFNLPTDSLVKIYDKQQDLVQNMLDFTQEYIPIRCRSQQMPILNWIRQGGLEGASAETKILFRLEGSADWAIHLIRHKYNYAFSWNAAPQKD